VGLLLLTEVVVGDSSLAAEVDHLEEVGSLKEAEEEGVSHSVEAVELRLKMGEGAVVKKDDLMRAVEAAAVSQCPSCCYLIVEL